MTETDQFTVTHPFHPLSGQQFPILAIRNDWGKARVQYIDPETMKVKSIPQAWTDLVVQEPFIEIAAGRAYLRLIDLQTLNHLLQQLCDADSAEAQPTQSYKQNEVQND